MEVARLSSDQLERLHEHESKDRIFEDYDQRTNTFAKSTVRQRRSLMPFEIQEIFKLCSLKVKYQVPEVDTAQSAHNQRLRMAMKSLGIAPDYDLSVLNVDAVHAFDRSVISAVESGKLQFHAEMASRGRRLKEQLVGD